MTMIIDDSNEETTAEKKEAMENWWHEFEISLMPSEGEIGFMHVIVEKSKNL
jgi:hypothetical protein